MPVVQYPPASAKGVRQSSAPMAGTRKRFPDPSPRSAGGPKTALFILTAWVAVTLCPNAAFPDFQPTPLDPAIRIVSDSVTTTVAVLLSFETTAGDYIKEVLPSGVSVDLDSVLALGTQKVAPYDTVHANASITMNGDTLLVSGAGFSAVIYTLSRELLPGEAILGEVRASGVVDSIVHVDSLDTYIAAVNQVRLADVEEAREQAADSLILQQTPGNTVNVYLDNDTTFTQLGHGDSGYLWGGNDGCDTTGTALTSVNGHGHTNAVWVETSAAVWGEDAAYADQGQFFYTLACDDDDTNEWRMVTFVVSDVTWSGYNVHWVAEVQGISAGVFTNTIDISVDLVEFAGPSGFIAARDVVGSEAGAAQIHCSNFDGSGTGTLNALVLEDKLYFIRLRLSVVAVAYGAGLGHTDFFSLADGSCHDDEDGCERPGPGRVLWKRYRGFRRQPAAGNRNPRRRSDRR